jgi:hypothetical protein
VGAEDAPALREAFDHALVGSEGGVPAPAYVLVLVAAAGAAVWVGRTRRAPAVAPPRPELG